LRRLRVLASAAAVLVAGTSGYAALDAYDRVPGILTIASPAEVPQPSGASGPSAAAPSANLPAGAAPSATVPVTVPPAAPLAGLDRTAPRPSRAVLASRLSGVLRDPRLGGSVGMVVRDGATGKELFGRAGDTPRTPASTTKLLTAAASLGILGPAATTTTRVVQGGTARSVVLVAGGDSLLGTGKGNPDTVSSRAGLGDLAAQVATALLTQQVRSVQVGLDDHIAAGPRYAPGWLAADIAEGFTGPVTMLGLSNRRAVRGRAAPADPAMVATQAFVAALQAHGVAVTGAVRRTRAAAHAVQLGAVTSAPVAEVLGVALISSDNALTETVARRAAVQAGDGSSFGEVAAFVVRTVRHLGIDVSGVRLVDASGLSRGSAIPPRVLVDVLDLAADGHDPALQQVVARLAVAGVSGTLKARFHAASAHAAAGVARAKTGTLTGVSAVAGTVVDRDGRLLTFAVQADQIPAAGGQAARAALDRVVATLAGCGCR
jgi:D-alanyl-D-alanine carboxypeptidase/D-alanyl-D-alanine-endopeptidase (penicillin-binding protein 4)